MSETTTGTPTTVRFGRRQTRGLLLGFSGLRVAAIACATGIFVPSMFIAGTLGIAATSPLWAAVLASAFVRWGGRPVIETLPTVVHYGARHALARRRSSRARRHRGRRGRWRYPATRPRSDSIWIHRAR
jgi:hypothetical protein